MAGMIYAKLQYSHNLEKEKEKLKKELLKAYDETVKHSKKTSIGKLKKLLQEVEDEQVRVQREIEQWLTQVNLSEDKKGACRIYYINGVKHDDVNVHYIGINNLERDIKKALY